MQAKSAGPVPPALQMTETGSSCQMPVLWYYSQYNVAGMCKKVDQTMSHNRDQNNLRNASLLVKGKIVVRYSVLLDIEAEFGLAAGDNGSERS